MRRSLVQSSRQATRALCKGTSHASWQSAPFICASCRGSAIASQIVASVTPISRRHLSISGQAHQQSAHVTAEQPLRESTIPQTLYDFFPETFPGGPPPKSPFTPDPKRLRKEFIQLQAKSHPDLAPEGQKRQSEAMSMRINEAYKVLQDPLKRAQYLLSLQDIDAEDESAKLSGGPLLMEVMEAREEVEEVENEEDLLQLRQANDERVAQSVTILEQCFANGDLEGAAQEAVRLRYWKNIEESIQGWEKGKGGGILHH